MRRSPIPSLPFWKPGGRAVRCRAHSAPARHGPYKSAPCAMGSVDPRSDLKGGGGRPSQPEAPLGRQQPTGVYQWVRAAAGPAAGDRRSGPAGAGSGACQCCVTLLKERRWPAGEGVARGPLRFLALSGSAAVAGRKNTGPACPGADSSISRAPRASRPPRHSRPASVTRRVTPGGPGVALRFRRPGGLPRVPAAAIRVCNKVPCQCTVAMEASPA